MLLGSCTGHSSQRTATTDSIVADSADFDHAVHFDYAKGIQVANHPGYKEVFIFTPDEPDTLARYFLYPRGHKPEVTAPGARYIAVPVRTMGTLSTTEIGALTLLDLRDVLVACSDPRNINDSILAERTRRGEIAEIGRGMGRNVEQIIATHPEIIMQGLQESDAKDEDIRASGIEIVFFNNWKEQSLLGRAEWMKFVGMLFGRNVRAEETFQRIEREYLEAKKIAAQEPEFLPVLYGQDYKGSWYVPGEYSYVTSMLTDAHIKYDFIPGQVANKPMSFEYVFSRHRHAPVWLSMMVGKDITLKDFLSMNERYQHFDAAKAGNVWIDRKRVNEYGGNDYWESGPYNPHLILKDLIKITRPHLLPDYETTYWVKLQ